MKNIAQAFTKELKDAEAGKKTSLPFIRHQLAANPIVQKNELFQVLVIGGSYYKSAILKRKNGSISEVTKQEGRQPIFTNKDVFLTFVADHIDPSITAVGINFAFPLHPLFRNGQLDGRLGQGTKEHAFEGLMGEVIGEGIEKHVKEMFKQTIRVSIANDTICLLLSGLTKYKKDNLAAGIVGTGLNFAMFLEDGSAINLESANFDKFPLSEAAKVVDAASKKPGSALIEKEIAGAYLYQVFNAEMKRRGDPSLVLSSTDQIDELAKVKNGVASEVAAALLTRSAQLVACEIAGITAFHQRNMTFNMEGSLFWKGWNYKETVEKTVKELLPEFTVSYSYIPDSGILGAAKLVA